MLPRAVSARVAYVPGTGFFADRQGHDALRLSYCYPEPARIDEGVRRLAEVVNAELDMVQLFGTAPATGNAAIAPNTDLA
jgi:DNA-binding transcriptional MocR family regulator